MATNRLDPLRELDRILGDTMRSIPGSASLPMDLYRDGDRFIGLVDMPGVDPKSIDLDVEDRTLTIRGERKNPADKEVNWRVHERQTGTFARQLALGTGLATNKIEATYSDGVLHLTIPVAEEAQPRKISVVHGEPQQDSQHQDVIEGSSHSSD